MIIFEWNEAKEKSNERKHKVTFEDAIRVFDDPYALFREDYIKSNELRWQAIGVASGLAVLLVVHTIRESFNDRDEVVRIISARLATRREQALMTKIVRKTLADIKLTPAARGRLTGLARRPDSEIDFSDIPELTDDFFKNAVKNPFYRPVKEQLTVRLDSDVIAWLRKKGAGYQTRMNALLRSAMLNEVAAKPHTRHAR